MLIGIVTAALSGCLSAQLAGRPGRSMGLALSSYVLAVPVVWIASIIATSSWSEAAVSFVLSALMQAVVFLAATVPVAFRRD
jgi:FtsH-binding integral membrane protein